MASCVPFEPHLYEALLSNWLSRLRIADSGLEAANVQSSRTSTTPNVITFFAAIVNLELMCRRVHQHAQRAGHHIPTGRDNCNSRTLSACRVKAPTVDSTGNYPLRFSLPWKRSLFSSWMEPWWCLALTVPYRRCNQNQLW